MRALLAGGLVLALAACSGRSSRSAPLPAPTTGAAPSVTTATTARVPPTSTTTTVKKPAVDLIPQETPDLAATALLAAWTRGDRHAALQVAAEAAVDVLFARPPQTSSDRGCQQPLNGASSCAFGLAGDTGLVQIRTVTLAGGWVVSQVAFGD